MAASESPHAVRGDSRVSDAGLVDEDAGLVDEIVELERAKAMIEAQVMQLTADLAHRADGWVDFDGVPVGARLGASTLAAAELAPALRVPREAKVTVWPRGQRPPAGE